MRLASILAANNERWRKTLSFRAIPPPFFSLRPEGGKGRQGRTRVNHRSRYSRISGLSGSGSPYFCIPPERQRLHLLSLEGVAVGVLVPAVALEEQRPFPARRERRQVGGVEFQGDLVAGARMTERSPQRSDGSTNFGSGLDACLK